MPAAAAEPPSVRARRARTRRSLRWRIAAALITVIAVLVSSVPVLAGVQYAVWHGDNGPAGCVSRAYLLVTDSADVDECVRERLQRLVDERGIVDTLVFMEQETRNNPVLLSRCHLPMHFVAQRAVRTGMPLTRIEQVAEQDVLSNVCAKGFVHGYLQQLGAEPGAGTEDLVTTAQQLCESMGDFDRAVCIHGIGHGIARVTKNDLVPASNACAQLSTTRDQRDCIKGAVMEVQLADPDLADRMGRDTDMGPAREIDCATLAEAQRSACRQRKVGGELLRFALLMGAA